MTLKEELIQNTARSEPCGVSRDARRGCLNV